MLLTVRDRIAVAEGFSVRGSAIRRRFEPDSATPDTRPAGCQLNEVPPPRRGLRLVELERARLSKPQG